MRSVTLASAPPDTAPNTPGHPSITDGSTNLTTTPALSWIPPTDPDTGDKVVCSLFFGTTTNPPLAYTGWLTNWSCGQLHGYTTYYWYLVACDSHNVCTPGPLWSFTTGDAPPKADFFAFSTNGWAPFGVNFYQHATSFDNNIVAYEWDFDGDGVIDSTDQNPSFLYQSAGNYPVTLTVTDANGGRSTITKPSYVHILDQTVLDLAPVSLSLNGTAPFRHIGVIYSVTNLGVESINIPCEWDDCFYASTNTVLDSSAWLVACFHESMAVLPGARYTRTNVMALPAGIDSSYNLFLRVDGTDLIPEINEDNNVASVPLNLPAPNLAPLKLILPSPLLSGQYNQVAWQVANLGAAVAQGPWVDEVFVSTNSQFDYSAVSLGTVDFNTNLTANASYWMTNTVQLPRLAPGTYYFFLAADSSDSVFETQEADNMLTRTAQVILGPQPDLTPTKILASPNPLLAGQTATLVWAVTNQGNAQPQFTWSDQVTLSTQAVWDVSSAYFNFLGEFSQDETVPAHTVYWKTNQVQVPRVTPGNYYLLVFTDANDDVFESNETNNVLALPVNVQLGKQPDLVPVSVSMPSPLPTGQSVQFVLTINNQGAGSAQPEWYDCLFLSSNSVFDSSGLLALDSETSIVKVGASYQVTNQIQLPRLPPGDYYLYAVADYLDQIFESNETNNMLQIPVKVALSAMPDLAPAGLSGPATMTKGQFYTVTWGVTNLGPGVAQAPWQDMVYFSSNAFIDATASPIAFNLQDTNLPPHGSYQSTNDFMCPSVPPGTYYFILLTDAGDQVYESAEDNNTLATPVVVVGLTNAPDLAPISLKAPSYAAPGQAIIVNAVVTNLTGSAASGAWMDALYLATNSVLDSTANFLGYQFVFNPVPGHGGYTETFNLSLPSSATGTYYLIFQVNGFGQLAEVDTDNNSIAIPIQVGGTPTFADLAPVALQAPATASPGRPLQVVCVVTNQGTTSATGLWVDQIVLSSNAVFDSSSYQLAMHVQTQSVAAAQSYRFTNSVTLPSWNSGSYYLILRANASASLSENTNNNTLTASILLQNIKFANASHLANGAVQLGFQGLVGSNYSLLTSTNLINWTPVMTFTCTNATTTLIDTGAGNSRRQFYRVTQ